MESKSFLGLCVFFCPVEVQSGSLEQSASEGKEEQTSMAFAEYFFAVGVCRISSRPHKSLPAFRLKLHIPSALLLTGILNRSFYLYQQAPFFVSVLSFHHIRVEWANEQPGLHCHQERSTSTCLPQWKIDLP